MLFEMYKLGKDTHFPGGVEKGNCLRKYVDLYSFSWLTSQ
jgi:hypothetical protein